MPKDKLKKDQVKYAEPKADPGHGKTGLYTFAGSSTNLTNREREKKNRHYNPTKLGTVSSLPSLQILVEAVDTTCFGNFRDR